MEYRIVNDAQLYHYGVPGMKWGVRKAPERVGNGNRNRGLSDKTKSRLRTAAKVGAGVALGAAAIGVARTPSGRQLAKTVGSTAKSTAKLGAYETKALARKTVNNTKSSAIRGIKKVNSKRSPKIINATSKMTMRDGSSVISARTKKGTVQTVFSQSWQQAAQSAPLGQKAAYKTVNQLGNQTVEDYVTYSKYGRKVITRWVH